MQTGGAIAILLGAAGVMLWFDRLLKTEHRPVVRVAYIVAGIASMPAVTGRACPMVELRTPAQLPISRWRSGRWRCVVLLAGSASQAMPLRIA